VNHGLSAQLTLHHWTSWPDQILGTAAEHQGSGAIVVIRIDTSVDAAISLLGDRIANVRRKDARCGLGWRKENRPPEWGPAPTVLLSARPDVTQFG
jgi:hypothetical protein